MVARQNKHGMLYIGADFFEKQARAHNCGGGVARGGLREDVSVR